MADIHSMLWYAAWQLTQAACVTSIFAVSLSLANICAWQGTQRGRMRVWMYKRT